MATNSSHWDFYVVCVFLALYLPSVTALLSAYVFYRRNFHIRARTPDLALISIISGVIFVLIVCVDQLSGFTAIDHHCIPSLIVSYTLPTLYAMPYAIREFRLVIIFRTKLTASLARLARPQFYLPILTLTSIIFAGLGVLAYFLKQYNHPTEETVCLPFQEWQFFSVLFTLFCASLLVMLYILRDLIEDQFACNINTELHTCFISWAVFAGSYILLLAVTLSSSAHTRDYILSHAPLYMLIILFIASSQFVSLFFPLRNIWREKKEEVSGSGSKHSRSDSLTMSMTSYPSQLGDGPDIQRGGGGTGGGGSGGEETQLQQTPQQHGFKRPSHRYSVSLSSSQIQLVTTDEKGRESEGGGGAGRGGGGAGRGRRASDTGARRMSLSSPHSTSRPRTLPGRSNSVQLLVSAAPPTRTHRRSSSSAAAVHPFPTTLPPLPSSSSAPKLASADSNSPPISVPAAVHTSSSANALSPPSLLAPTTNPSPSASPNPKRPSLTVTITPTSPATPCRNYFPQASSPTNISIKIASPASSPTNNSSSRNSLTASPISPTSPPVCSPTSASNASPTNKNMSPSPTNEQKRKEKKKKNSEARVAKYLNDPELLKLFYQFALQSAAVENIKFWQANDEYVRKGSEGKLAGDALWEEAKTLYADYISESGGFQVNITSSTKKALDAMFAKNAAAKKLEFYRKPIADQLRIFSATKSEVAFLVEQDLLPRFLKTDAFRQLHKQRKEARAARKHAV